MQFKSFVFCLEVLCSNVKDKRGYNYIIVSFGDMNLDTFNKAVDILLTLIEVLIKVSVPLV